jgi:hypothetical protein
MEWLNLHIPSVIRSPEFIGSSPVERATWLCVHAYAAEIECGGKLIGALMWKDRQWQQACGVTRREVLQAHKLLRVEGEDIVVNGYSTAKEAEVKAKRTGAKAGAMARWHKDASGNAIGIKKPYASRDAEGEEEGEEEGKGEGELRDAMPKAAISTQPELPLAEPKPAEPADPFNDFWKAYPRKVGKQAAAKAFQAAAKANTSHSAAIVAAAMAYGQSVAKWPKDRQEYVPHPATWLNQGRFDDDPAEWARNEPKTLEQLEQETPTKW